MGKPIHAGLYGLFIAFWLALLAPSSSFAQEWPGRYSLLGITPDGSRYKGQVGILPFGEAFAVFWKLDNRGGNYKGVGIAAENFLAVAYGQADGFGVVLYRIEGERLIGQWFNSDDPQKKINLEILKRDQSSGDLQGRFNIERAHNSQGQSYQGEVDIKRQGETYLVTWHLPAQKVTGIGLRKGNYLAIAYGAGPGLGLALYENKNAEAEGEWIGLRQQKPGVEIWRRGGNVSPGSH